MKRMLSFITGQRLPNFIPLNEPATSPDAVHFLYTPSDHAMKRCWDDLQRALKDAFPQLRIEEPVEIRDAYDGQEIGRLCRELLDAFPGDEWTLNATGGTKLMSGPAMELFFARDMPVLYVETPRRRTLRVRPDWSVEALPFEGTIDLKTYFSLYNVDVHSGNPQNRHAEEIYRNLRSLDWQIWPGVRLQVEGEHLAEFNMVAIKDYQMTIFECKRLTEVNPETSDDTVKEKNNIVREKNNNIVKDLFKLYQVRQHFGGPFGRSFWVFSGGHGLRPVDVTRIGQFGIVLVTGPDIAELIRDPSRFHLPERLQRSTL